MNVIDEIAAERRRQIEAEGWSIEHDDQHDGGELVAAAACYTLNVAAHGETEEPRYRESVVPYLWPWDRQWWKPKNPRRDLVRAAALIVAEIERIDRAENP